MTTSAAKPLGLKNKKKDVSASARNFSVRKSQFGIIFS